MDEKELEEEIEKKKLEDEYLDEEFNHLSRKQRIKMLKKELGPDWKQQVKDGMATLVRGAGRLKVDGDAVRKLHGIGGLEHLRETTDPRVYSRKG